MRDPPRLDRLVEAGRLICMAVVYILKSCHFNITYAGSTTDLDRRLKEHNSGKNFFTKRYAPWKLFYKEEYQDLSEAREREKYLKTCAGRKFIKKLFNNYK